MDTRPRQEIPEEHGKRSQLRLTPRSGLISQLRLAARSGFKNRKNLKNQFPSPQLDPRSGLMPTNKWQGNLMVNTK